MSNKEVAGLQALAQKHGGQLSVNPETGLPEAGFLDSILPAVAGAGLTYLSGGAISPLMSAGIVGGLTALDSKDLSKGLMAGLGAYGGGEMVGGLAGLGAEAGYMPGAAGEAARQAATQEAIANGTYQSQVGTGLSNFIEHPINSLSTLGGGSVLKGSLPILEGLAPAAADMLGEEEDDGAPAQHKGYIRKYALDPVTGQYKQVGVYEAGGDPNKDVTSEAGTAGAFGAVAKSDYEKAQGMAAGGTANDSERIYDYLMGRGPNPMQFTHTTAPQVDYSTYMPKPITPTTPILDQQYDEYGNPISKAQKILQGGNGLTPEQRAEQAADNARPQAMLNGLSRDQYFGGLGLTREEQNAVRAQADKDNPKTAAFLNAAKFVATPVYSLAKAVFGETPVPADPLYSFVVNADAEQRAFARTGSPLYSGLSVKANPTVDPAQQAQQAGLANSPIGEGFNYNGLDGGSNWSSTADAKGDATGGYGSAEAARDAAGRDPGNWHDAPDSGGPSDARGGYLQHGQFDQHMARGGIANLHQYNLGSYSDGGRLLKGPGDGVSDDIPATIGHGQPARLADGEFVIPARIVSEIGNGSTDAGARELYKMMDRIQAGRKQTVGKDQVAKNSKAVRHLPA